MHVVDDEDQLEFVLGDPVHELVDRLRHPGSGIVQPAQCAGAEAVAHTIDRRRHVAPEAIGVVVPNVERHPRERGVATGAP